MRRSLEEAARQQDDSSNIAKMKHIKELSAFEDEVDTLKKSKTRSAFFNIFCRNTSYIYLLIWLETVLHLQRIL